MMTRSVALLLCLVTARAFAPSREPTTTFVSRSRHLSRATTGTALNAAASTDRPFAVIVQTEIQPDRMAEFLELIEKNAKASRQEPGCLRFDVLRSQDAENRFFFYELYRDAAALEHHKQQPHYNLWADFKASGGTVDSVTHKTDGEFIS